jgi:hypothetical protein
MYAPAPSADMAAKIKKTASFRDVPLEDVPDVDDEAAKATSPAAAAHRLAYTEAVFHVITGMYLLPLRDTLDLGALQLLSEEGFGRYDAAKHSADAYRRVLSAALPAHAIAEWVHTEAKGPNGKRGVPGLVSALHATHESLGAMEPLEAQRRYVTRVRQLPEFCAAFFYAGLLRHPAEAGVEHGSRSAPDTPEWAVSVTTTEHAMDTDVERLPVLVAINYNGVFTRPAPPVHAAGEDFSNYTGDSAALSAASATAASGNLRAVDTMKRVAGGTTVPWMRHGVQYVEVWGVKKARPVFTYRVRERQLTVVELHTPQYKELAAVLHANVFALLAQKEGKPRAHARSDVLDYGASAKAAKEALASAKAKVVAEGDGAGGDALPEGWSEIRDPITGATAYWNQATKKTVWARPRG